MKQSDNKPVLYILMEIKARELEGRFLLAIEAASRGIRVILGHKSQIFQGLQQKTLLVGLYHYKDISRASYKKLQTVRMLGSGITSQDEESGLLSYSYDKFLANRSTPETAEMARAVFCWGRDEHSAWTKKYPHVSHKFHITGSPRIDYWRTDFSSYFQRHNEDFRQRFGKYVLISSNFTGSNCYMTLEQRIAQGRSYGSIVTFEDEQRMRHCFDDNDKMFALYVQLINKLAKKYPDINFVIRPHPVERIEGWKSSLTNVKNIHVLFEGGISPWERAACAVIHNGCTTGMEAYVSGTPAIAYTPFESPINREIPNKLSIQCTTEDEVSDVLARIFNGEEVNDHHTPENDTLIRNRLANVEGDTAAKRIVDVFETLDIPESPPIKPNLWGWYIGMKNKMSYYKNFLQGNETRVMRKFPGLKLQELKQIQEDLSRVDEKYKDCTINHLFGDVFVVEKD